MTFEILDTTHGKDAQRVLWSTIRYRYAYIIQGRTRCVMMWCRSTFYLTRIFVSTSTKNKFYKPFFCTKYLFQLADNSAHFIRHFSRGNLWSNYNFFWNKGERCTLHKLYKTFVDTFRARTVADYQYVWRNDYSHRIEYSRLFDFHVTFD